MAGDVVTRRDGPEPWWAHLPLLRSLYQRRRARRCSCAVSPTHTLIALADLERLREIERAAQSLVNAHLDPQGARTGVQVAYDRATSLDRLVSALNTRFFRGEVRA